MVIGRVRTGISKMVSTYKKILINGCLSQGEWFEIFMMGNLSQTGIVRRRDFGLFLRAPEALLGATK